MGGHVPPLGIDAPLIGHPGIAALVQHLGDQALRDLGIFIFVEIVAVGGVDDLAVGIGHDDVGVGNQGDGGHIAAVEVVLNAEVALVVGGRKTDNIAGVALHGVPLFRDNIAVGQEHKGGGQQRKG